MNAQELKELIDRFVSKYSELREELQDFDDTISNADSEMDDASSAADDLESYASSAKEAVENAQGEVESLRRGCKKVFDAMDDLASDEEALKELDVSILASASDGKAEALLAEFEMGTLYNRMDELSNTLNNGVNVLSDCMKSMLNFRERVEQMRRERDEREQS